MGLRRVSTMVVLGVAGCGGGVGKPRQAGEGSGAAVSADADGDGLTEAQGDCDDADPSVNPRAEEVWYDGVDQNCDGRDDDRDRDGHPVATDCDDADVTVHPGARERWYDGLDQDCAGDSDFDADGDGVDASLFGGADCDDADADVSPDASEDCARDGDEDCDGAASCADDDCARHADCHELDCGDGVDGDRDGLLDCEDADCAEDLICLAGEVDCADGLDNEPDGLVDCADDDCWGLPDCPHTRVWLAAGVLDLRQTRTTSGTASSGVVRSASGGTRVSTAAGPVECAWTGSFDHLYRSGTGVLVPRHVSWSSACPRGDLPTLPDETRGWWHVSNPWWASGTGSMLLVPGIGPTWLRNRVTLSTFSSSASPELPLLERWHKRFRLDGTSGVILH